jgi:hypothetical protein
MAEGNNRRGLGLAHPRRFQFSLNFEQHPSYLFPPLGGLGNGKSPIFAIRCKRLYRLSDRMRLLPSHSLFTIESGHCNLCFFILQIPRDPNRRACIITRVYEEDEAGDDDDWSPHICLSREIPRYCAHEQLFACFSDMQ